MHIRTKILPCVIRPCWVSLLGDVDRRCPENVAACYRMTGRARTTREYSPQRNVHRWTVLFDFEHIRI
jgi:hypothetical protein